MPQRAQPLPLVAIIQLGTLKGLPCLCKEEGGDDVKSAWPLYPGLHTCYNGRYNELPQGDLELISKTYPSTDCSLQFDYMKEESLVTADQRAAVNTFLGLVHTARHVTRVDCTRSHYQSFFHLFGKDNECLRYDR